MIQYSTGQIVDPGLMHRDVFMTYRYDPVVHPPHRAAEAGQRQVGHEFDVVVEALLWFKQKFIQDEINIQKITMCSSTSYSL